MDDANQEKRIDEMNGILARMGISPNAQNENEFEREQIDLEDKMVKDYRCFFNWN